MRMPSCQKTLDKSALSELKALSRRMPSKGIGGRVDGGVEPLSP
jgi:hypothetical protein